ncbi:acetyl-mannosamine transferase [Desulfosarcina alkanivorans]|jgi:N-acetylglucosaminyldiphosphoundecaprenol N-acetyl-beta-D-mannosaminyltransferase|uniref:Acetyl-mannosamine transferase n=1 Tax=Desulfosarcina alkanivorans TaxID=571177 RepID=A0A5K7YHM9_9BACT|nr:WecB/TagA/CpsF family glycosyltransferase [Desulfosarcina alkanivorans]BBO68073.1 acetyl-mannosamine transferase [Desulfosarcina alkanivorans]
MRIKIADVGIDTCSFEKVVERITEHLLLKKQPEYVVTPNAQHIVLLQKDAAFYQIYRQAFLVVPDGVPLLWSAKLLGTPLQGRVNGTDLFERLCQVSAEKGFRVFLLGGRPGAAKAAARLLQSRNPDLEIVGTHCPPYGFENSQEELRLINSKIKTLDPDILFVGLGAPKQEKWIYSNCQEIGVPISIGIGVSFELVSGMVKRAPKPMQQLGLEWLFRLFMEPRRLWKRYVLGNTIFLWLVIKQRFRMFPPPMQ